MVWLSCIVCKHQFPNTHPQRLRRCCSRKCRASWHQLPQQIRKRFLSFVKKTSTCWLWQGGTSQKYGMFFRTLPNGREQSIKAHRMAWILFRGKIHARLMVLHRCDIPICVRPAHLFLGTAKQNMLDASKKGRLMRGQSHHKAKLTESDIIFIRQHARHLRGELARFAQQFHVTPQTIGFIVRGKTWRHLLPTS